MKLFNKIFLGAAAIAALGTMQSCSDDATLADSNAVYIEITPSDIQLTVGKTQRLSARVSNDDGKTLETPVEWSVDDESVVRLYPVYKEIETPPTPEDPEPEIPENPDQPGEEGGEDTGDQGGDQGGEQAPASRADEEVPGEDGPAAEEPAHGEIDYWAIEALPGAQGKSTIVRATLENGQFAVVRVAVVNNELGDGSISPDGKFLRSYQRQPNDTCWFNVNPIELLEDFDLTYKFNAVDIYSTPEDPADAEFRFNSDPSRIVVVDKVNQRVGIVYTAPRMSGKFECEITVGNDDISATAVHPIYVYPKISAGFEVDGKRPLPDEKSPSNPKTGLITVSMDINSTYACGVCNGIEGQYATDINNAVKAEQGGLFYWTVDGSAVVVEDNYIDLDYKGGFVSYLKVRSGIREGVSTLTYHFPDTTLVCNITVENYNVSHPVERVVVKQGETEVDEVTFKMGNSASLEVEVEPSASFAYHIPEITVDDPSILTPIERGTDDGFTRRFNLHRPGTTTVHFKALEAEKSVKVTVLDRVSNIAWAPSQPTQVTEGSTIELTANATMASGDPYTGKIEYSVSDPSLATIALKEGSNNVAVLKGLKEGVVTVTATAEEMSVTREITIATISDIEATESSRSSVRITQGQLYAQIYNGTELLVRLRVPVMDPVYNTYKGSDADVTYSGVREYNWNYDFTVTKDGANAVYNGYIQNPANGQKILFKNLPIKTAGTGL